MLLAAVATLLCAFLPAPSHGSAVPHPNVRLALSAAPADVGRACADTTSHTVSSVWMMGSGVKMTSGTCATSNATLSARSSAASSPLPDGRAPGDECDTPCRSTCFPGNGANAPAPSDCQTIFDSLMARPDQTLTLGENGFILFTFQTCGTSIANQIAADQPTPMTYCYRDWGGAGRYLANHCQGTTGSGGKCVAAFGSFTDVPDWYIQVYTNNG